MTSLLAQEDTTTAKALEREFAFEILKGDRLRVTILIGVIVTALLIALALRLSASLSSGALSYPMKMGPRWGLTC